jgi:cysteine desulfurase
MDQVIYADYNATTPLDKRVLEAMMPYMTDVFYNAGSTHMAGLRAQQAVMKARFDIAQHIHARPNEVIFTSGATEAVNLAIQGCAAKGASGRTHVITVATEHHAVLDACHALQAHGFTVTELGVDEHGRVRAEDLRAAMRPETLLVSIMAVNNETGVKQDIATLSAIAHEHGAWFMTDATQAYGKIPLDVDALGIDLMAFSGHKIYGPKGVGALFVRTRPDRACPVAPMIHGGGQEQGVRSGTLNVPGIVGLAAAGTVALQDLEADAARVAALRDLFESQVTAAVNAAVNGAGAPRSYNASNICFHDIDADMLLMRLPHVAASKGSACSSADPKPSHVLTAMGRTPQQAAASIRFSFGRFTTEEEVRTLADDVIRECRALTTHT